MLVPLSILILDSMLNQLKIPLRMVKLNILFSAIATLWLISSSKFLNYAILPESLNAFNYKTCDQSLYVVNKALEPNQLILWGDSLLPLTPFVCDSTLMSTQI